MVLGQADSSFNIESKPLLLCGGWQAQIREHIHLFSSQMHLEIDLSTLGDISELGGVFSFQPAFIGVSSTLPAV